MNSINEIMMNPVRVRIIQELSDVKSITINELSKRIGDVPKTTMYRHIKILLKNNILSVVSERKVRGSVERTIALNTLEILKHNNLENADENVFGFLMTNYAKFHRYFNGNSPNPGKDKIFFNNTVLMMSDDEFDDFIAELRELILKYQLESSRERKPRDISIISSPVERD